MPPRNPDIIHFSDDVKISDAVEPVLTEASYPQKPAPVKIVWRNVIWFIYLHLAALCGVYLLIWAKWQTWLATLVFYCLSGLGVTAGAHRLWAHRSYRAKLPTRIFLALCNSMAFQNDIIEWSRDHRVHHKFSETNADPHNAKRGFFFSHMGWLLVRKHPDVAERGKVLDVADILADPVCMVQRKLYLPSVVLLCFVLPTMLPWYFWGESALTSFCICGVLRYVAVLHATWCVNSVAHSDWGSRPYDRFISPVENFFVSLFAVGEGFHNYHHTFPFDYATSEFGWRVNPTSMFIDAMAAIGQVTDRKMVSHEAIRRRMERTGDGTTGFGLGQIRKK